MNATDPIPTDISTKWADGLADDRSEQVLHLPVEYNINVPGFHDGFGGPCSVIGPIGTAAGTCSHWPFDAALAFATFAPASVPIPTAVWLFGSGLIGLIGVARRKA